MSVPEMNQSVQIQMVPGTENLKRLTKTACVTGASGMIGRRIVSRLLQRGVAVRILSRGSISFPGVQVFSGSLSDEVVLERFVSGADMVFHCAGELNDKLKMHETNVHGTQRIVTQVARHGVQYFCHISSAGVVGATSKEWVDESTSCNPSNAYEKSKMASELQAINPIAGCSVVILRPTNVVDESHLGELALPHNASLMSRFKAFIKGAECAHIVHADDVADAAIHFIDRPSSLIRLFFVSIDDDPHNTVSIIWSLYRLRSQGIRIDVARPFPHLPLRIPYLLRRLSGRGGNLGNVKYSSERLTSEGFRFRYRVLEAIDKIIVDRSGMQSAAAQGDKET